MSNIKKLAKLAEAFSSFVKQAEQYKSLEHFQKLHSSPEHLKRDFKSSRLPVISANGESFEPDPGRFNRSPNKRYYTTQWISSTQHGNTEWVAQLDGHPQWLLCMPKQPEGQLQSTLMGISDAVMGRPLPYVISSTYYAGQHLETPAKPPAPTPAPVRPSSPNIAQKQPSTKTPPT
jgi:hypothetical protein